jgi:hypothetical protein
MRQHHPERSDAMDRIVERCAGLDVHKDSITACVRVPSERGARHQETQTFGTTTRSLLALRDWLAAFGVTVVGMESTGCTGRVMSRRLTAQNESRCRSIGLRGRRGAGRDLVWCVRARLEDDPGGRQAPHIVASALADSTLWKLSS